MPTMLPSKDPEGNDIPVGTVLYKVDRKGIVKSTPFMDRIVAARAARSNVEAPLPTDEANSSAAAAKTEPPTVDSASAAETTPACAPEPVPAKGGSVSSMPATGGGGFVSATADIAAEPEPEEQAEPNVVSQPLSESGGSSGTAQTVPAGWMPLVDVSAYRGVQSELTGYTFTQLTYATDRVQGPRAVAHTANEVVATNEIVDEPATSGEALPEDSPSDDADENLCLPSGGPACESSNQSQADAMDVEVGGISQQLQAASMEAQVVSKCAATPAAPAAAATDNKQMPSALAAAAPAAPPLEASSTGSTCSTRSMTATAAPEPPQNQSIAQALPQNTSQVPVPPPQDAAPPSTTQDDDDARQQAKKARVEAIDVKLSQSGSEDEAPGQPQIPEPPLQDPAPPQGSALAESLTKHLRQKASPQDKQCQAPALITIEPSPHGVTKSFPPPELSNRAASPEIGTQSRRRKNLDGWYVGRAGGLEPPLKKMLG